MPVYRTSIDQLLFDEDIQKCFKIVSKRSDAAYLSALWLTGARPSELKTLRKEDVKAEEDRVSITLLTRKLGGKGQQFKGGTRVLTFTRSFGVSMNPFLELVVRHARETQEGEWLFPKAVRTYQLMVERVTTQALGKAYSPYHFRHSCLTHLAMNNATIAQLQHFKGSATIASVMPYIHATPYVINLQNLKRSRGVDSIGNSSKDESGGPCESQLK